MKLYLSFALVLVMPEDTLCMHIILDVPRQIYVMQIYVLSTQTNLPFLPILLVHFFFLFLPSFSFSLFFSLFPIPSLSSSLSLLSFFFFLPFYHLKGTIVTSSTSSLDILAASLPLLIMIWKIQRQPAYIYPMPWYMPVKRFPDLLAFAA